MTVSAITSRSELVRVADIKPNPRNARTHSNRQLGQIANSIKEFGFVQPVVLDEQLMILAGHARWEVAPGLGLKEIPAIIVSGLTSAQRRALMLADNKLAANAGWDRGRLAIELPELAELLSLEGIDIGITGFDPVEVDQLATDFEAESNEPGDDLNSAWARGPAVTRPGDLWLLGEHRLSCGDARSASALSRLMGDRRADVVILDPPYNLRIRNLVGRGQARHREFAMASGEMNSDQYCGLLGAAMTSAIHFSRDGSLHYIFIDWRHIDQLVGVGKGLYTELLNIVVWSKSNAGQGSFYRSQHELIAVFRAGSAAHLNNIELGRHGRNRSNVWHYAGVNTFRAGRMDELRAHPTAKPVALIADALKDCTRRGDIVLDTFAGSGATIMAAERVGRIACAMDLDAAYVDVCVRRWQSFTGRDAILSTSNKCFDEIACERSAARQRKSRRDRKAGAAS